MRFDFSIISRALVPAFLVIAALAPLAAGASAAAAKPQPDLLVAAVGSGLASTPPGSPVATSVTVRNAGRASAGVSSVQLLLSLDRVRGKGDVVVTVTKARALKPRTNVSVNTTWSVPGTISAGNYFVLACVDTASRVKESNERNNCTASARSSNTTPAPPAPPIPDTTAPFAPLFGGLTAASPSSNADVALMGAAEANSTVTVFRASGCVGDAAGTFTAPTSGIWMGTVRAALNASTRFSAFARDAAGNTSPCTTAPFTFDHDSIPPAQPTVTAPSSPSNDATVGLTGTSETGSTVRLFHTADCSGNAALTFTAAEATWAKTQTVTLDGDPTSFSADARDAAGNVSICSTSATYEWNSNAPDAPRIVVPEYQGAYQGTDVRLEMSIPSNAASVEAWTNANCSGAPESSIDAYATQTLTVDIAGLDAPVPVSLRSFSSDGTPSPCVSTEFWNDTTSWTPQQSSMSFSTPNPTTIVADTVMLYGSGRPGSVVRIASNFSCSTVVKQFVVGESGRWSTKLDVQSNEADFPGDYSRINEWWICGRHIQSDSSGFVEKRRFTYLIDRIAPDVWLPDAPGTGSSRFPTITGTYVDMSSLLNETVTIELFASPDCSGPVVGIANHVRGPYAIQVGANFPAVENETNFYTVRTIDPVGHVSPCSLWVRYYHVS